MGTEVLRPQDFLNQRLGVVSPAFFPRRKNVNGNSRTNKKQPVRTSPERSKPSISKRSSSDDLKSTKNNTPVLGQVTILRRGESLDSKVKSVKKDAVVDEQIVTRTTERLASEPKLVPKQIRIDDLKSFLAVRPNMYAGSAFSMSPSPSSLPQPSFSRKKEISPVVVESATRDLRRLLRLE